MGSEKSVNFYNKLLSGIVLLFCLFFVVLLNMMRYEQLDVSKPLKPKGQTVSSIMMFSIVFEDMMQENKPRMLVLFETDKSAYYQEALSQLKPELKVVLVNCAKGNNPQMKAWLRNNQIQEEPCEISQERLSELMQKGDSLIIWHLKENEKMQRMTALAAIRENLQPKLKMIEVRYANRRV